MENTLNEKLIIAVKIGYLDGVQKSLVEGADPNAKDNQGASAIDWAKLLNVASEIKNALKAVNLSYEDKKKEAAKSAEESARYSDKQAQYHGDGNMSF